MENRIGIRFACESDTKTYVKIVDGPLQSLSKQKTLLVVSFPFTVFLSYVAYSPILVNYTPDHWCAANPDFADVVASAGWSDDDVARITVPLDGEGKRSSCLMYDISKEKVGNFTLINIPIE
jgi:hypothetical protein